MFGIDYTYIIAKLRAVTNALPEKDSAGTKDPQGRKNAVLAILDAAEASVGNIGTGKTDALLKVATEVIEFTMLGSYFDSDGDTRDALVNAGVEFEKQWDKDHPKDDDPNDLLSQVLESLGSDVPSAA